MKHYSAGLSHFMACIPKSYVLKLGQILGPCLYFMDRPHRRRVQRNLQFCYPEWSAGYIRKMSLRIFEQAGITILEIIQSSYMSAADIMAGFRIASGEKYLIDSLKEPSQGLIFTPCHIGNWEVGLHYLGCMTGRMSGKPLTAVARKFGHAWLDDWFDRYRKHPDQWAWFQRPWKKSHPELYPEWKPRRHRRKKKKSRKSRSKVD